MLPFEMLGLPDGDTQEPAGARQEQDLREAGTRDGGAPVHQERSTSENRPIRPQEETVMLPFEMLDLPQGCDTDEDE
jgi:hypothetical protein